MMYSLYIVCYLFGAGAGSGAYALSAIFGFAGQLTGDKRIQEYGRIGDSGFLLGPALVALSAIFLFFDLGSPANTWLVIANMHPSILTIGTWSLLGFCLCAGALILFEFQSAVRIPLQILAFLLALALMFYTGIYLASMPTIPFHNSWLLIALLVFSSLASGAAVITLYGFLNLHRKAMVYCLRTLPRIDLPLIIIEALILLAYLVHMQLQDSNTAHSVSLLTIGAFAPHFWLGVVLCGLVAPSAIILLEGSQPRPVAQAISSLLVLVGSFTLRYAIVAVGLHITQL